MSRSWLSAACVCVVLLACTDAETPLTPLDADLVRSSPGSEQLSGGGHFLPPVGPAFPGGAALDRTLLPHLAIEVAACSAGGCGGAVETFSAEGAGAGGLRLTDDHYHASWSTRGLAAGSYAVTALVAGTPVASARVELKARGPARSAFQIGSTIPLKLFVPVGAVHVVGPGGGIVEAGGLRLEFPAGAVDAPIGVTVRPATGLPDPDGGIVVAGTTFDLGPDGAEFSEEVLLTLPYAEAALDGRPESSLRLQRFGTSGWEDVSGSTVDESANTVTGGLSGFSEYGVISYVDALPTLSGWGSATVDGTLSPIEWATAGRVAIALNVPEGGTVPAVLYVMNDLDSVYFALSYERAALGNGEVMGIGFDNDDDGVPEPGDDLMGFESQPDVNDRYRSTACGGDYCDDEDDGGTEDGNGAFAHHGTYAVFEMSRPLDSADDLHDMSVAPGDRIGFYFGIFLEAPSQDDGDAVFTWWPDYDVYAHIQLQPGPGVVLSGSGTAVLDSLFTEYANAACVFFLANHPDGTATPARACVMNDATNLYVAVLYEPGAAGTKHFLGVDLDESGDGTVSGGDDLLLFQPWPYVPTAFSDQAWSDDPTICPIGTPCHFEDTLVGGTHNGHGIWYLDPAGTYALFEMQHPLWSGDAWDMTLASGGIIGARILLTIEDGAGNAAQTWLGDPTLLQIQAK